MTQPLARSISAVLVRDLRALARELDAYPDDASLWQTVPAIPNSAGTLALHLAGNIRHFLGTTLGGTAYVRDRDAEFRRRDVPRAELRREIDAAVRDVEAALMHLTDEALAGEYPLPVAGHRVGTGDFLVHLATHFAYHLGQLDYHRRAVVGVGSGVGAMSPTEIASARAVG